MHGVRKKVGITVNDIPASALSPLAFLLTLVCAAKHLKQCPLGITFYADEAVLGELLGGDLFQKLIKSMGTTTTTVSSAFEGGAL